MIIKRGSLILHEEPYVFALGETCRSAYCATCLLQANLKCCQGCKWFFYCSKNCQRNDWENHKNECKCLQKIKDQFIPCITFVVARILFKLEKDNQGPAEALFSHSCIKQSPPKNFSNLTSHEDLNFKESRFYNLNLLKSGLKMLLSPKLFYKYQKKIGDIFGKVCTNSINILNEHYTGIGVAIYINFSSLNHNCSCNANLVFNGPNLLVSMNEDVVLEEGEPFTNKIFISYIDPLDTFQKRQWLLREKYFFDCKCQLCEQHLSLAEYDCSFLPAEYALPYDENTVDLEQEKQTEMVIKIKEFLANLDKIYINMYKQQNNKNLISPNLYPSSTNIMYNKCLMEKDVELKIELKEHALQKYHLNLAIHNGNAIKAYSSGFVTNNIYRLFDLSRSALDLRDVYMAMYFNQMCKDLFKSSFSSEVIGELKRFPQYRSILCLLMELLKSS